MSARFFVLTTKTVPRLCRVLEGGRGGVTLSSLLSAVGSSFQTVAQEKGRLGLSDTFGELQCSGELRRGPEHTAKIL